MIGIVGGYGDIGKKVAEKLSHKHKVLIGGRNASSNKELFEGYENITFKNVDIFNYDSLCEFTEKCELVINCVGPSWKTNGLVELCCIRKKIHLLDIGYPEKMDNLQSMEVGSTILYGVGTCPGLSELLQIYLGNFFDRLEELNTYFGGRDRFTRTAAEDYLYGITGRKNMPLATWKQGKVNFNSGMRKHNVELTFFEEAVNIYPYLDDESLFVANKLRPLNASWNLVIEGGEMNEILDKARILYPERPSVAIELLCRGSALETMGKGTYIIFLVEGQGIINGNKCKKMFFLRSESQPELTSIVVTSIANKVLEGKIEIGLKPLSKIESVNEFVNEFICAGYGFKSCILDNSIDELNDLQEGEI